MLTLAIYLLALVEAPALVVGGLLLWVLGHRAYRAHLRGLARLRAAARPQCGGCGRWCDCE